MAIARAMHDFITYKKDTKVAMKQIVDALKEEEVVVDGSEHDERKDVALHVAVRRKPADAPPSSLAGLNCDAFGGPSPEKAQKMVYWSDIPSDSHYVSPFHEKRGQRRRYLTFEPGRLL